MNEKSIDEQLAEAEERGYRRGLNEKMEQRMQAPGVWESEEPAAETPAEFRILGNARRSIWD